MEIEDKLKGIMNKYKKMDKGELIEIKDSLQSEIMIVEKLLSKFQSKEKEGLIQKIKIYRDEWGDKESFL